jgi:hypothetical protein
MVPLILALLLLVLFKPIGVLLWYVVLICSIILLVIGILIMSSSATAITYETQSLGMVFFFVGISCLCYSVIVFLLNLCCEKIRKGRRINPDSKKDLNSKNSVNSQDDMDGSNVNIEKIKKGDRYRPKSFSKQSRNFFVASLLIVISLISFNSLNYDVLKENIVFYQAMQKGLQDLGFIFAAMCAICGGLLMLNWILGLFKVGRKYSTILNTMWKGNILYVVVMVLLLLYIPMTTSVFSSIQCSNYSCEFGTQFYISDMTLDIDSVSNQFLVKKNYFRPVCQTCNFTESCKIAELLCPPVSDMRLDADPSLSCTKEMYPFYLPGSILMFICCTIGVPVIFYQLVRRCHDYIEQMYYLNLTLAL